MFARRDVCRRGRVGQDLRRGHTDVSPKRLSIRAAVNSAGLQITDFDYKGQICFKAWFARHRPRFISFLYSSQPHGVIQGSQIYLSLHFWIGFQVFPPAIGKGKHVFILDFENKEGKRSHSAGFVKACSALADTWGQLEVALL